MSIAHSSTHDFTSRSNLVVAVGLEVVVAVGLEVVVAVGLEVVVAACVCMYYRNNYCTRTIH